MSESRPVTLITGAASGIGFSCAKALSSRGHRVAMTGRRAAALETAGAELGERGRDWEALPADVGDPEQAGALVARVIEAFGRIDAVVNNAGWTPLKPVTEHTPEDVAALFAVNAIGPTLITIAAARAMLEGGGGRIVNVSSMASADPFPGLSVYGAAKASMNILTKGLANELGENSRVRVFSVAPGAVETPLLRSLFDAEALPAAACLTPGAVADVIAACVMGERDAESGSTIWVPSP